MVDLNILENGVEINGEILSAVVREINEFYRVETKEGCLASYRVPFNSIHFAGSELVVEEPIHDKRMSKKIRKLIDAK